MERISIRVSDREVKKQGDLFGIFFEDLNHAADGGLYGELVRNRSFEFDKVDNPGYHSMTAWDVVVRGDSHVQAHVETAHPMNKRNPHYLALEILTDGAGGGIRNEGFGGGIPVKKGEKYRFSCYYRVRGRHAAPLYVRLEDKSGSRCYGELILQPEHLAEAQWQYFEGMLEADATDCCAGLVLLGMQKMRIELDMISLFPEKTFRGRKNGLRADIAQLLADMKPKFMRFPGGCLTHIGSLDMEDRCGMYRWKNTVGPVEERPSRRNNWNYNQTFGLGFYEYFLFCEDIGAEPLPVISAGYDPHNLRMAELDEMQEWIDEALDLIEFANGDMSTKWGALRAQMGHEAPFGLKYLAIGNEEVGDAFFERYEIIAAAVKEKHPDICLIDSAGPGSKGSEFIKGWEQSRRTDAAFVDEHFYQCPEWFVANADRYEAYAPEPKAFLGEYASQDDTWKNALAEAVFMTGMEKAEGAGLACYAPMLSHVEYKQWHPDMIYYDNHRAYGTPSYYIQKLFMNEQGVALLAAEDDMVKREKKVPSLAGKIGMRTQCADVEISGFVLETDGQRTELPDFGISEKEPYRFCLDTDQDSYTVSFRFRKKNGETAQDLEGLCPFELEFAAADENNRICWRINGWQRLTSLNGLLHGKNCDMGLYEFISEIGREYEAKLVVEKNHIRTYIDGVKYCEHFCRDYTPEALYYSAVRDVDGSVIVKLVNAEEDRKEVVIQLPDREGYKRVIITAMEEFDPDDRNSLEEPEKVSPKKWEICDSSDTFAYQMRENSVVALRFTK